MERTTKKNNGRYESVIDNDDAEQVAGRYEDLMDEFRINEHDVETIVKTALHGVKAKGNKTLVFISQPMKDKTDEEIEIERNAIIQKLEEKYGDNFEIIDSFLKGLPHDVRPVWCLGLSLELLSNADVCVFARGWNEARGCSIEHKVCEEYHITIWEI